MSCYQVTDIPLALSTWTGLVDDTEQESATVQSTSLVAEKQEQDISPATSEDDTISRESQAQPAHNVIPTEEQETSPETREISHLTTVEDIKPEHLEPGIRRTEIKKDPSGKYSLRVQLVLFIGQ